MLNLALATIQKARLARDPRFDGLFFVGVKSTGIFCRPICKARMPLEKNVAYYNNAVSAMDAGFRPCLMCRPDSAPGSYAWKGVETTVERGVQLITTHLALSIAQIAEKLGISARYFTKLFEQHLHISPKRYQLLSRLLFAKQLLHESSLPIEQVAHACGFSAAKPLQYHMKTNTGLTPSQIRRANSSSRISKTVKVSEVVLYLSYRPPYQWCHIRDFFKVREIHSNEKVDDDSISKMLRVNGETIAFTALHQAHENRFKVTFSLENLALLKDGIAALKKMLDLNCEPYAIAESLAHSGFPSEFILPGLRLPGVVDRFEAGCRAIVGQQVTVKAAVGQLNLLQQTLNPQLTCPALHAFVSPQQVADADLSFLKMPNARKATLTALAKFMLDNPAADIEQWLSIKGIGAWTVNYVTMRNSETPDIFLEGDLVVRKQLERLARQDLHIEPLRSAPWRSYLTLSLWHLANTTAIERKKGVSSSGSHDSDSEKSTGE